MSSTKDQKPKKDKLAASLKNATELIRRVSRMFYEPRHVVILDYLTTPSLRCVSDETLCELLHTTPKDGQRLGAFLRDERLLNMEQRLVARPAIAGVTTNANNKRPMSITRTFYFVDYEKTVAAIRGRLDRMRAKSEGLLRDDAEKRGYKCQQCGRRWGQLDVHELSVDMVTMGFKCDLCDLEVVDDDTDPAASATAPAATSTADNNKSKKKPLEIHNLLMDTIAPLIHLLKAINADDLPKFNLSEWLKSEAAAKSDDKTDDKEGRELAVAGSLPQADALAISVLLPGEGDDNNGPKTLPSWYTHSTVTGESFTSTLSASAASAPSNPANASSFMHFDHIDGDKSDDHADKRFKTAAAAAAEEDTEDPVVSVRGSKKLFSAVSDDDKQQMTSEEYDVYFEHFLRIHG